MSSHTRGQRGQGPAMAHSVAPRGIEDTSSLVADPGQFWFCYQVYTETYLVDYEPATTVHDYSYYTLK
jgi:hypothetical protein